MAFSQVDFGASGNDGTGDTLRSGADKINNNFTEIYSAVMNNALQNRVYASPDGSTGAPTFRSLVLADLPTTGASSGNVLKYNGSAPVWSDITTTILQTIYPIGSLYVNFADDTSPATVLGFGTWTRIEGRVVVGKSSTDTEFDTLLETGGAKTHTLSASEMPSHTHSIGTFGVRHGQNGGNYGAHWSGGDVYDGTASGGNTGSAGSGAAHNNLQPYITASMWRRTA